jgi:3-oxoacyl-[acyl-carrier protein] reductase
MCKSGSGWMVNIGSSTGMSPIRPFREYNKTSGDVIYASAKLPCIDSRKALP